METLIASWGALVSGVGGSIERGPGFVAARCRHAVFNNALLLAPQADAIAAVRRVYGHGTRWSLWTCDAATDEVAAASGLVIHDGTTDMTRTLDDRPSPSVAAVVVPATPAAVAEVNGLEGELVSRAAGFKAFTAGDGAAGIMSFRHHDDVQLSFLATRPESRGRGLASSLVAAALHDARNDGAKTASLQSTPAAVRLYERAGFSAIGEWREWELSTC